MIHASYSPLQDYLYKSPNFIKTEEIVEIEKLATYFPDRGDRERRATNAWVRRMRAEIEGANLYVHFPVMAAQSNLYLALAWFERHLNRLARFCDEEHGTDYRTARGNGPARYFAHLKSAGIKCSDFEAFERLQLAIRFRNALLHASGDLELSSYETQIRQAVKAELFIEKSRRKGDGGVPDDQGRAEVWVAGNMLGVNYRYPMRVLRDAFGLLLDISDVSAASLNWEPHS